MWKWLPIGHGLNTVPCASNCHEQVIPDWAEATTMSMLGPLTCSALTVIDPVFPPDELVCSLTMRLMPPGNEMAPDFLLRVLSIGHLFDFR